MEIFASSRFMEHTEVYPLFLVLAGRRVLVVGAGVVAARKVEALLAVRAEVVVVARDICEEIGALAANGRVELHTRGFQPSDVSDVWLVVACTDDPVAQREVGTICEARRVFCIAVDDLSNATAYGGSIVRRPPFVVAISSSAQAPALTRLVREVLEQMLPPQHWIARARALRAKWRRDGTPHEARFQELVAAVLARDPATDT